MIKKVDDKKASEGRDELRKKIAEEKEVAAKEAASKKSGEKKEGEAEAKPAAEEKV